DSILMTSAPMSPRYIEHVGPAPIWEKSMTRMPSRLVFSNCAPSLDLDADVFDDPGPLGLVGIHGGLHLFGVESAGFVTELGQLLPELGGIGDALERFRESRNHIVGRFRRSQDAVPCRGFVPGDARFGHGGNLRQQ